MTSAALFLTLLFRVVFSNDCAKRIVWDQKYYVRDSHGYNLQLCCGVKAIWAAKLVPNWRLVPPPLGAWPIENLTSPGSEFMVSQCSDGTVSQGYVEDNEGTSCEHQQGLVVRLKPDKENGFEHNFWYALCYELEGNCKVCSFELFCPFKLHQECTEIWVERQVVNVTNSSMTILIRTGQRIPFLGSLKVSVWDHSGKETIFQRMQENMHRGQNYSMEIGTLMPDSWYRVHTCINYKIPKEFLASNDLRIEPSQHICLEDESFRTRGSSTASTRSFSVFSLCAILLAISLQVS